MISRIKTILSTIAVLLVLVSCQQELAGRLDNLEGRVSKLEELCSTMNGNISSLRDIVTAFQTGDYITSVKPLESNGKTVGYTISFAKGQPITVYHGIDGVNGKDGASGKDGINGHTPVVGVVQDNDGVWYWTIDGEWLRDSNNEKVRAVGTDGKDGEDGQDGSDGKDGADGKNGTDGVTPLLKIDGGYWFVSTDSGKTWTKLGKATGEDGKDGADGRDGVDGDSMFSNIDYSTSTEYVIFALANGTKLKIPTWYAFEQLKTMCNQMNTNISALQTLVSALQNNDYVTSVAPLMDNGVEVGYTISFSKSNPITIYHGKNGADGRDGIDGSDGRDGANGKDGINGEDGQDGHTPIIGVKQDSDGFWCWTVDGEWLLDNSGQRIKASGKDGTNGQDGAPGKDGKDGITPLLKIEDGYWFLSYDGGVTWSQLGKAVGENGHDGKDGKDGAIGLTGDSMFTGIDSSNGDFVIFTLIDGTEIKVPTWYAFEQLRTLVGQLNSNIEALQSIVSALQDNDYINSIQPITENGKETGYIINFTKSGSVTIFHGKDGADGHTPLIGVRQDTDGVWYWTVDGEWLTDGNGQKVKAVGIDGNDGRDGQNGANGQDGKEGVTPYLKIESGYWFVSYDDGATWSLLSRATGADGKDGKDGSDGKDGKDGKDGDAMFQSISITETEVTFVTAEGQTFVVKRTSSLSISFDSADLVVMGTNATRDIHYTISSGLDDITIEALGSADIRVKVNPATPKTGTITVKTGSAIDEFSKVVILVSNGSQAIMRTLTFEEAEIKVEENTVKTVASEGGAVTLEFFSNADFDVLIPDEAQSWISLTSPTKALSKREAVLSVLANDGDKRSAIIHVVSTANESLRLSYTIEQIVSGSHTIVFADPNFKAALVNGAARRYDSTWNTNIDSNQDGEIQVSEAEVIKDLAVDGKSIESLDEISYFTRLKTFSCRNNAISRICFDGWPAIETLNCSGNILTELDPSPLTALKTLDCSNNQIASLDVSSMETITELKCGTNPLTELKPCKSLRSIDCSYNQLTSLELNGMENLTSLDCSYGNIRWLSLSGAPYLYMLYCIDNDLRFIDLYSPVNVTKKLLLGNQKSNGFERGYRCRAGQGWTTLPKDGLVTIYTRAGQYIENLNSGSNSVLGEYSKLVEHDGSEYLEIFPPNYAFEPVAGEHRLSIFSHEGWELISVPAWLSAQRDGPYDLIVRNEENTSDAPRFGDIVVKTKNGDLRHFQVSQGKKVTSQTGWADRTFYRRNLIEYFTWDECNLDPEADECLARMKEMMGDRLELINLPGNGRLVCSAGVEMMKAFGYNSYPMRILNGYHEIKGADYSPTTHRDYLLFIENEKGPAQSAMSVQSSVVGDEVEINLYVYSKVEETYWLTGFILEDGIVSPQAGSAEGDNYVHNNVVRASLTSVWGWPVHFGEKNTIKSLAFRFSIPEGYNPSNMRSVFVLRRDSLRTHYPDNALSCPAQGDVSLRFANDSSSGNDDINPGTPIVW